uniref:Paralemmin-1 n=1 Tax=Fundulus heteroclitus TaxID=8078 RepID=A0A3Q2R2P3_FUNHE
MPQEKRKWQTEMENKHRQLEDERRALQHLKLKALRERWLLEGAQTAGEDQDRVRSQLEEDEVKTRNLEDSIRRSDLGFFKSLGVNVIQAYEKEKKASVERNKTRVVLGDSPEERTTMYSVEIKVERDRVTGETRVLSTNTKLPVDLSDQGVKVYEDEQKVVHEMNGEDAHLLSYSEVEELIHKADEASIMSQSVTRPASLPPGEVPRDPAPSRVPEITGLEATVGGEASVAEASADNPVTMVFMGYQDVEDEDETRKVLGLQGTVKAELVLIDDVDGKVDPLPPAAVPAAAPPTSAAPPSAAPPSAAPPTPTTPPETMVASSREAAVEGGGVVGKKKQPCKCCSIM